MHDTYTLMRHFADSWFLILMVGFFAGCILWALRPGSRHLHEDAAASIFQGGDTAPSAPSKPETRP
ncbi:cbb3-type cytochrome c oxidase subunit 3 [Pseudoroseicyclus aestuarii]|uniref:Cytochrome c oxidase cbb3-type subunit 4 n=1 Tax=Pseudoroseicyclus aestuarii TaxID=1795041 RepID=A0A318ST18_9RHOB|nr:cbb3-type cytochrome c oxidase subunit 3 [Pseudoroseicyclus aestuarii]PYE82452.1 cytochrome c oxidase cbb3-type subunit 4 [Pseudoroseicyclus aestuarii]